MAVSQLVGGRFIGTSTERGSFTTTNLRTGWIWIESDTFLMYYWNGSTWNLSTTKAVTETLTNKTLTSPIFSTISNTGTLTLPTSTDTLVGRATTDTLTNKTLTSPVISSVSNTGTITFPTATTTLVGRDTTDTLTNKTLTAPVISTISNTGTVTLFTASDTVVGKATTDTLTNKTIDATATGNVIKHFVAFGGARTPTFGATAYQTLFQSSVSTASGTEANVSLPLYANFYVTKFSAKITSTNSLNGNTVISFRDDGADATGATLTFASTDTAAGTLKETGALTATVASGSLVDFKIDASASGSGTGTFAYLVQGLLY